MGAVHTDASMKGNGARRRRRRRGRPWRPWILSGPPQPHKPPPQSRYRRPQEAPPGQRDPHINHGRGTPRILCSQLPKQQPAAHLLHQNLSTQVTRDPKSVVCTVGGRRSGEASPKEPPLRSRTPHGRAGQPRAPPPPSLAAPQASPADASGGGEEDGERDARRRPRVVAPESPKRGDARVGSARVLEELELRKHRGLWFHTIHGERIVGSDIIWSRDPEDGGLLDL